MTTEPEPSTTSTNYDVTGYTFWTGVTSSWNGRTRPSWPVTHTSSRGRATHFLETERGLEDRTPVKREGLEGNGGQERG